MACINKWLCQHVVKVEGLVSNSLPSTAGLIINNNKHNRR